MGLKHDPRCPYVHHKKSSVYCTGYLTRPDDCKFCGWHPEEHERRVKLLRSGQVKSFLHINLSKVASMYNQHLREEYDDD